MAGLESHARSYRGGDERGAAASETEAGEPPVKKTRESLRCAQMEAKETAKRILRRISNRGMLAVVPPVPLPRDSDPEEH
jgi:hypothetical protein